MSSPDLGNVGGHRLINSSTPIGKLSAAAMAEILATQASIVPLDFLAVSITNNATTFTVVSTQVPSAGGVGNGVVHADAETIKNYANVGLLNAAGDPIVGANARNVWGRVTSVTGPITSNYTYTVSVYDDANQNIASPASPVTWNTGTMGSTIGIVEMPNRKSWDVIGQVDSRTRFVGLDYAARDQDTVDDLTELFTKTGITEGVAVTYTSHFQIADGQSLVTAISALDSYESALNGRVTTLETSSSSTGIFADNETPTGTIDGTNRVFTLAHSPKANSTKLDLATLWQQEGIHYNIAGTTLTYVLNYQPQVGEAHRIGYRY